MAFVFWGCGIILLVVFAFILIRKLRDKLKTRKVIKLSLNRGRQKKMKPKGQACSLCKKKSGGLSFYAAEDGRVIGVCRDCRPQAERRALLRL